MNRIEYAVLALVGVIVGIVAVQNDSMLFTIAGFLMAVVAASFAVSPE